MRVNINRNLSLFTGAILTCAALSACGGGGNSQSLPATLDRSLAVSPSTAPALAGPDAYRRYRPTPQPTAKPTPKPTATPTAKPSGGPTVAPTGGPTVAPTGAPTAAPTAAPTIAPTAAPTIAPTAPPTVAPTIPPTPPAADPKLWTYSQLFSANSPFHRTVADHKASGATVLSQSAMTTLWNEGISTQDLGPATYMFPIYVASASDPVKTISCTGYGRCNGHGLPIHVPNGVKVEPHSDGHIGIVDTANNLEFDGYQCAVGGSSLSCTWGGAYALGGNGIENAGSNAVHGGYAAGLMLITAEELLNGYIGHALAMNTQCLNNPTVYPADQNTAGTDKSCRGSGPPSYGDLVHLTLTPDQIAATNHSPECKTILTALATYGAYTYDTGNLGLSLLTQSTLSYTAFGLPSPWATPIVLDFAAAGEANAAGSSWTSCLNGLTASNFELLQIAAGSY